MRGADIKAAAEPDTLRVLAAHVCFVNEVYEMVCEEEYLFQLQAWRVLSDLQDEAVLRLPGFEQWQWWND